MLRQPTPSVTALDRGRRASGWRFAMALIALSLWAAAVQAAPVMRLDVEGPIGPATSDFVTRALDRAAQADTGLVVLRMDTPGGLDTAMRDIIRAVLASPVPVASFVAPRGARAASAGTYILYASHVAAMAPGTNLGAATPVQVGGMPEPPGGGLPEPGDGADKPADKADGDGEPAGQAAPKSAMERKMINDAVAYIRSLAQLRGRNAEWAEQAVREAASLPAADALEMGVIDVMARDVDELLSRLHGRDVEIAGRTITLDTEGAAVTVVTPDWRTRLLGVITDPNVAYILMLIGIYGLIFELANPGYVLPGVAGAICLVLALYAFQVLPVNYAGLGLVILGILFMVGEAFAPSFGALGLGGVIAFVIGSVILYDDRAGVYAVSLPVIGAVALASAAFFIGVVGFALRAQRRPVVSGQEEMIGAVGEALEDIGRRGRVRVHSETWTARAATPVRKGQPVRVTAMDGLVLTVEPLKED